ncbi:MAG TPA: hypothetical protein VFD66_06770 [Verrucomicrobiae bacterium]|nr:hypothetical protein [Verrucomicrobiae bacterium]
MQIRLLQWKISRSSLWFQIVTLGVSAALCVGVGMVFWRQPDFCAAVLVLPRWLWLAPGLFFAMLAWTSQRKVGAIAVIVLWMLFTILFVEEASSLVRSRKPETPEWREAHAKGAAIRVISLNCAGAESAAAEVADYHPDLVLLEESPSAPCH